MKLLDKIRKVLEHYEKDELDDASKVMGEIHVTIYEGTQVTRDLNPRDAIDLLEVLKSEWPQSLKKGEEWWRATMIDRCRSIEQMLWEYLSVSGLT